VANSKANIATHYVHSSRLPALETRLASMHGATVRDVAAAIDEFVADEAINGTCNRAQHWAGGGRTADLRAPFGRPPLGASLPATFSLAKHRDVIDRCFGKSSVEEIVAALQAEVRARSKARHSASPWR